jgi:Protein of unknown function (DUF3160)/FlgD Ig-like domain
MKSYRIPILLAVAFFCVYSIARSQTPPSFDIDAYKAFLASHQEMTTDQLYALHPTGYFKAVVATDFSSAKYFDSIDARYSLTSYEKSLLGKHGFVVTERLRPNSFGDAFIQIYNYDLPVFISADAILHALHMSWDAILMDVETSVLTKKLDTLLTRLHNQLPLITSKYSSYPEMKQMSDDIDVYLTVPRMLLGTALGPKNVANTATVEDLLNLIRAEKPNSYPLFSSTARAIDFSQFTVRGHYTQSPELTRYFQAMIWLGRTEIYLMAPVSVDAQQTPKDIQRQIIDAVLLKEVADSVNAFPLLKEIDETLHFFVGESDNVTLPNIGDLIEETKITSATQLLDTAVCTLFQQWLEKKSYAFQRITSQILMSDPMSPGQIRPASAFLLLGQRFIIDSYTTGNVVYDKILYKNEKVTRMLPSSLDVLYALGNNAAAQLLKSELDQYHYSSNLSALRYLIESYEPGFWQGTIYNGWLNSIRALNPPTDRTGLPNFMQSAAWWQEKTNTQLASWAQLRHDFILYAKQSYTPGMICSFPESYVEPIPQFFDAIKEFADNAASMFQRAPIQNLWMATYFIGLRNIADTLGIIAQKEFNKTPLLESERLFLQKMLYKQGVCGAEINGWYAGLFYRGNAGLLKKDLVIADIHTAPTDAAGVPIGWVLHVGTGPVNLAVVVADLPGGTTTAFIGPVMSYYEHLATNFKRLTDEEWQTLYNISPSLRPSFVNLYLADSTGSSRGEGSSLITGVERQSSPATLPSTLVLGQNFPNPFNSSTIISFIIPDALTNSHAELAVYDIQGRLVKRLLSQKLPAGNYATRWDGTMENGLVAASGVYFYHLIVGSQRQIGKMSFVK